GLLTLALGPALGRDVEQSAPDQDSAPVVGGFVPTFEGLGEDAAVDEDVDEDDQGEDEDDQGEDEDDATDVSGDLDEDDEDDADDDDDDEDDADEDADADADDDDEDDADEDDE